MASNDPEIGIGLNVDGFVTSAKKAENAAEKVGKADMSKLSNSVQTIGQRFKTMGDIAMGVLGGNLLLAGVKKLADGASAAVGTMADGFNNVLDDKRVYDRMNKTFGPENVAFLDETSNKIKSAFNIDDGDTRKAMVTLGNMGMSAEQTGSAISLAADISRAKNMSIEQSSKLVGKAFQGNEAAAKKLGIQIQKSGDPIKDQAALMDALQAKFGGAAAEYARNLSPLERARQAIQDMVDGLAEKLIPVVVPFLQWVSNTLVGIANSEQFAAFTSAIGEGIKVAWSYAKEFGLALLEGILAAWEILKQLPAVIGNMWNSGKLVDWVIAMIGGVFKFLWGESVIYAKLIWSGIMDGIPMIVGFLGKALTDMLRSTLGETISNQLGLGDVSDTFNQMIKDGGSKLGKNAKTAFDDYQKLAKESFGGAKDITKDMFSEGGLDVDGALAASKKKAKALVGIGDETKKKIAKDTADVYGMTGKASQTIGMSKAGKANAAAKAKQKAGNKEQAKANKQRQALQRAADQQNKKARAPQMTIYLQSQDRMHPIMGTV